jgi:hypothetical protein
MTNNISRSLANESSAKLFHGSKLFGPCLLPGMKDVRYDDKQDGLQAESVLGLGRPLWTTKRGLRIEAQLAFARAKLLTTGEYKFKIDNETLYHQDLAILICRLGLF